MELVLFLAASFFATFVTGMLLEKIRIPWIFSALLIGLVLAAFTPFKAIIESSQFQFLADLGVYFLLFIIGFEIDIKELTKRKRFITTTTVAIIVAEATIGSLFVHFVFGTAWYISILVALSFATVGEAVLLPILDEFKLTKTKLGQTILGIGVLDDVIEVCTIMVMTLLVGSQAGHHHVKIGITTIILLSLFGATYLFSQFKNTGKRLQFRKVDAFFLFVIFFIFAFVGIGLLVEAAALGAILAGIALKNFIPKTKWRFIDSEIRTVAYGFFAPIFFLSVGLSTDVSYLLRYPLLIVAIMLITNTTKILTSYLMARRELGSRNAVLLGISLTVKFSTSIVIIKLLLESQLIPVGLYSVLVGTTILFKFIVPVVLSTLISRWKITGNERV